MRKLLLTKNGREDLWQEAHLLKERDRPAVIAAIAEARAHGDLKENAEYHAAREQQSFIEGRIKDIEAWLSDCEVIDIGQMEPTGKVIFGSTVTLRDLDEDSEQVLQLVGEPEADVEKGRVSITSPIARAVVGKMEGDEVTVQTPGGDEKFYAIVKVAYI